MHLLHTIPCPQGEQSPKPGIPEDVICRRAGTGDTMAAPDENTEAPKAPDMQGALEGLRKANEALLAKLQEMEKKNSELDAKVTAMSGRQAEAAPPQPVKTDLDIAYEKALAELGIKKKD